ncbi:MAG: condensation domain protein [Verrucomicrobia bacterium]|nr:condensation domain protein [Verrucomicrobiota bacterium]MBV8276579.1 condensation domain protein [Verrucomicrobiota bacterium]
MEISDDKRTALKEWLASGKVVLHPLTLPQRELWETSPVPVTDVANHICCLINIRGVLTPEACEEALRRVVERQDVLRLSFLPGKAGPVQMIRRTVELNLQYRSLPGGRINPEAVEEAANEVFSKPLDLLRGPVYRAEVLRLSADVHVIVLAIHHAIADGWTLGIFTEDLCTAYVLGIIRPNERLPAVPLTYAAWGAAEREFWLPKELERRVPFWRSHLSGTRRLWSSFEGPITAAGPAERLVLHFPPDLAEAARELARTMGATLFSTLLTAFQIALSRWTGEPDVLVGTPTANRARQSVRETMGYFAGIVPIRCHVEAERTFGESLKSVHQTATDCFANAMPFAELSPLLGEKSAPGHNPIFEVRFALQNHPFPEVALHGLSASLSMRSTGTARFHLGCEITVVHQGLEVVFLFRAQLFPLAEIKNLANLFQAILADACSSPDSRIDTLVGKNS